MIKDPTPRGSSRRTEILNAARSCFIQNGLHTTSMQDLLKAAKVSAGVFYHHFPSKGAVIAAVADEVLAEISTNHAESDRVPLRSAADFVRKVAAAIERIDERGGSATLAIQLWSESLRNPDMAKVAADALRKVLEWFTAEIRQLQENGHVSAKASARQGAGIVLGIVHGFMVQRALLKIDAKTYCAGLKSFGF
jgi:AcrR family transcriptional regulator